MPSEKHKNNVFEMAVRAAFCVKCSKHRLAYSALGCTCADLVSENVLLILTFRSMFVKKRMKPSHNKMAYIHVMNFTDQYVGFQ